ncbi:aquaporin rerated protein, other eukaryote [Entomortierella parvispora]|uniref:Aquaporin rerated protein, other eukaryote n=1 Tax=Entomortierella parvispora TaxID=205924 RepID=A0A9P3HI76_9FUNG|nr:aquaporin rerated protein, other eukaryote [Entomortierella parvispora]
MSNVKGWCVQSLAEFIGTAMYMYLAIGGADSVTRGVTGTASSLGQAFAFGFGLLVTAWAFFRISGAQFNPAVTLSALITGHISVPKAALYVISQLLGAMLGVALVRGTTPSTESIGQVNALNNGESIARGFFLEFFLTTILCFVYHLVVHEKNRSTFMAALPYGLTIFSCHLFATRYTNASINPARAFGTSIAARSFAREHWIYWFGPLCGAILAAALYILFRFVDYDQYSAGIDAENEAQYQRAQAAVHGGSNMTNSNNNQVNYNDQYNSNVGNAYVNRGPDGTTTTTNAY